MDQAAVKQQAHGRDVLAGFAITVAVVVVAVAVPLLAAQVARGEGGTLVPSLPVLLVLSAVSVGVALLALYRLARERVSSPAAAAQDADDARAPEPVRPQAPRAQDAEPAPNDAALLHPDEVAALVEAEVSRAVQELRASLGASLRAPVAPVEPASAAAGRTPAREPQTPRRIAAPAPHAAPPPSAAGSEADGDAAATETCEIVWWHGARRGGFEARVERSRKRRVAERSPMVAWKSTEPPPPDGPAAAAHRALVERLVAEGWQPADRGDAWYAARFHRRARAA